jgi:aminomethyltransferase
MGYDWMVDLRGDDDFVGRAALERIKAEGVSRRLVGVEIDGPDIGYFTDGSMIDVFPVHDGDGALIGKVTSATHSPRQERNIGYAMVPATHAELGTPLRIEANTGMQDAVVVPKPFHDPRKDIPKG